MVKKKKQPMTRNEKLTLYVSFGALTITLLQFILSIPLISNYFFSPQIIATKTIVENRAGRVYANFQVFNNGRSAANNLEISLFGLKKDSIYYFQSTSKSVESVLVNSVFKSTVIKIDHFVPKEMFAFQVECDSADISRTISYKKGEAVKGTRLPVLTMVKYENGMGIIK